MSAAGAEFQEVIVRSPVDLFWREQNTFVLGVSGLTADAALIPSLGWRRLGRFDDIRGRGLGRSRGVLPRRSELCLQLRDGAIEDIKLRLLRLQLCLLGI